MWFVDKGHLDPMSTRCDLQTLCSRQAINALMQNTSPNESGGMKDKHGSNFGALKDTTI